MDGERYDGPHHVLPKNFALTSHGKVTQMGERTEGKLVSGAAAATKLRWTAMQEGSKKPHRRQPDICKSDRALFRE